MNARHLHPSARKNTAAVQRDHGTPASTAASPADLLLCGHHYLVSRRALAAAGASVNELPGTSPDVASWIREAA
jgi:hypothetical protein